MNHTACASLCARASSKNLWLQDFVPVVWEAIAGPHLLSVPVIVCAGCASTICSTSWILVPRVIFQIECEPAAGATALAASARSGDDFGRFPNLWREQMALCADMARWRSVGSGIWICFTNTSHGKTKCAFFVLNVKKIDGKKTHERNAHIWQTPCTHMHCCSPHPYVM